MAECGIEKYDQLPARIGIMDVDYHRWLLYRCDHPSFFAKIPILRWFVPPTGEAVRAELIWILDLACHSHSIKRK